MKKSNNKREKPTQGSGEFAHLSEFTDEDLVDVPLDLPSMMVELAKISVAFLVVEKFDDGMRTVFPHPEATPWLHHLLEKSATDEIGLKDEWAYAAVYDILTDISAIQPGVDVNDFPIIACDTENLPEVDELSTWEKHDPRHVEYINDAFKEGLINAGSTDYEVITGAYYCWKFAISLKVIDALRSIAQVHIDSINRLKEERGVTERTK